MSTGAAPLKLPASLADLKTLFDQQVSSSGHVTIDGSHLGIASLDALLAKTVGPNLTVTNVTVTLSANSLGLTGIIAFLNTGFHVSLTFTEAASNLNVALAATQVPGTSITLTKLVAQVAPNVTNAPAVLFSSLQVGFDTGNSTFIIGGTTSWQIPLGTNQPSVQATLVISQAGASLSGSLTIGTAAFNIALQLQKGANLVTGSWTDSAHPLGWDSVVTALGLSPKLNLPNTLPNAGFHAAQLSLDISGGTFTLTGQTTDGAAFLLASKQNNVWGFAFGAAVANNWTFSQISSGLSILDFLVFQQAYLIISSFTQTQFTFPQFALMTTPIDVVPGLNFGGAINFASGTSVLSKNIHSVMGASTLAVEGSIGTLANTRLTAALAGSMTIPPAKNLKMTNPELIVIAAGPVVEIQGTLEIMLGKQVVDVTGRLAISPEEADFTVDVKGNSLLAPFGFTGVKLEEIGVSLGLRFTPPGLDLSMEALFQVGSTPADKCAIEFEVVPDAVNPILLWGQFSSLSFATMFGAVCPKVKLPAAIESLALKDAFLFFCEQPTVLPDNTAVTPGFAISGTLGAFAFTMAAALKIDFNSGISGSAAMSPIHLMNNALSVTGKGKLGGPAVAFNTVSSPFLDVTLDVALMGVGGLDIRGTVTSTGFSFFLKFVIVNVLSETLTCTFSDSHNFSAATDLHFHLDLTVGPFKAPKTDINLGSIHINTEFTGHMDLTVTSTSLKGSVNGTFDGRSLPSVSIDASTSSLTKIPQMVIDKIKAEAATIYADVLGDATKWAGMVASGAITGADDTAKVLTSVYGQSKDQAEALLKKLKIHESTTVHVDTTSPHVDTAAHHGDVAAQHTDTTGPHVDVARNHVDTSATHVDTSVFGHHGDVGGHSDQTITPHGDTRPHIDTTVTPHVDASTPHVDVKAHVDQSEHIDA